VTLLVLLSFLFAAVTAAASAGLYLAWPRRMTAEEWVMHRREATIGPRPATRRGPLWVFGRQTRVVARLQWLAGLIRADLRLLELRGLSPAASEEELIAALLRIAALGAAAGLAVGTGLWLLAGRDGPPTTAVLLLVSGGVLMPALRWVRFRRQAALVRASISRRLPRLLTGSRVLLESGAATPQQALQTAASVYSDPAADVLREALLDREVRRVELQDALDQVGRRYGLEQLQHLADAYRVGARHGTQMADLLSEFAHRLREEEHAAYRERMTRAPVLMTLPALIFFVLPILALVLLLVLSPLEGAFSQL
jgi:Flp pilus assembly protein TadB